MKKRIPNPFPEQALKDAEGGLKQAASSLAPHAVTHSNEERQRLLRIRRGGPEMVRLIADLSDRFGVSLGSVTAETVLAGLKLGENVTALKVDAAAVQNTISDTARQAYAEAWDGALSLYRSLDRVSGSNEKLADALRPIRKFLTLGKRNADAPVEANGGDKPPSETTK